jgi:hypothetical protein
MQNIHPAPLRHGNTNTRLHKHDKTHPNSLAKSHTQIYMSMHTSSPPVEQQICRGFITRCVSCRIGWKQRRRRGLFLNRRRTLGGHTRVSKGSGSGTRDSCERDGGRGRDTWGARATRSVTWGRSSKSGSSIRPIRMSGKLSHLPRFPQTLHVGVVK